MTVLEEMIQRRIEEKSWRRKERWQEEENLCP